MNHTAQSWWFIFYKDQLLLEKKEDGIYTVPCGESSPIVIKEKTTVHNITTLEGRNCKAFSLSSPIEESEQWIMIGLRASYEYLPLSHYQTAGKQPLLFRLRHAYGTERIYHEALSEMWPGSISFHFHSDSCISEKKRFTTLSARPQF